MKLLPSLTWKTHKSKNKKLIILFVAAQTAATATLPTPLLPRFPRRARHHQGRHLSFSIQHGLVGVVCRSRGGTIAALAAAAVAVAPRACVQDNQQHLHQQGGSETDDAANEALGGDKVLGVEGR